MTATSICQSKHSYHKANRRYRGSKAIILPTIFFDEINTKAGNTKPKSGKDEVEDAVEEVADTVAAGQAAHTSHVFLAIHLGFVDMG